MREIRVGDSVLPLCQAEGRVRWHVRRMNAMIALAEDRGPRTPRAHVPGVVSPDDAAAIAELTRAHGRLAECATSPIRDEGGRHDGRTQASRDRLHPGPGQ